MAEPSLSFGVLAPTVDERGRHTGGVGCPQAAGRTGDAGDQQKPSGRDGLADQRGVGRVARAGSADKHPLLCVQPPPPP